MATFFFLPFCSPKKKMLRITSLLYTEKLWTSPIIEEVEEEQQVVNDYGSIIQKNDAIQTREIREGKRLSIRISTLFSKVYTYVESLDQETSEQVIVAVDQEEVIIDEDQETSKVSVDEDQEEVVEIHIPEQIDEVEEEVLEEDQVLVSPTEVVIPVEPEEIDREMQEVKEELNNERAEVNLLKIDTKMESDTTEVAIVESPTTSIPEEALLQSNISSASSIPVVTPTSSQSTPVYHLHHPINDKKETVTVIPRQRKTSLLRRETDKFNDRRKSLTKKLRKALTVDLK